MTGAFPTHLFDIASLSRSQVERLFAAAAAPPHSGLLDGATLANLFYESSTRTRVSFELAACRLGAEVVNINASASSATKGEALPDTMLTLAAMGLDFLVIRHPLVGSIAQLAAKAPSGLHLVNAGDGAHAHPSQALIDAWTLLRRRGSLDGLVLTIAGDIRHSRVARSNVVLFTLLGAREIRLAAPPELLPEPLPAGPVRVFSEFDAALEGADAVMMLRLQKERMSGVKLPAAEAYHAAWGLTAERLARAGEQCFVLHPGPINRGIEIASEVADSGQSLILEQVANGVRMRMAILAALYERPAD